MGPGAHCVRNELAASGAKDPFRSHIVHWAQLNLTRRFDGERQRKSERDDSDSDWRRAQSSMDRPIATAVERRTRCWTRNERGRKRALSGLSGAPPAHKQSTLSAAAIAPIVRASGAAVSFVFRFVAAAAVVVVVV